MIISQKLRGSFSLDEFIENGIEFRPFFLIFFPPIIQFLSLTKPLNNHRCATIMQLASRIPCHYWFAANQCSLLRNFAANIQLKFRPHFIRILSRRNNFTCRKYRSTKYVSKSTMHYHPLKHLFSRNTKAINI